MYWTTLQAAACRPVVPPSKVLAGRPFIGVVEERHHRFLQSPRPCRLQTAVPRGRKGLAVFRLHPCRMPEPVIARPHQRVVPGRSRDLVLLPAHFVQRCPQMLGDVKLVEDDLAVRFRQVRPQRGDVGVPHVHGHGLDRTDLFWCQSCPIPVQAALFAVFSHVQHPAPRQIVHQRQIVVTLAKRLLIDTDLSDRLGLAALQSTLYRSLHDAVYFVPTQVQQPGHCFLAGRLEPGNRQRFQQRREAAGRLLPRQFHHAYSVLGAFAERRLGV